MAVAFGTSANTTYASRTNTTITAPASIADGDVLLLFITTGGAGGSTVTATLPSGFTQLGNTISVSDSGGFQLNSKHAYKVASSESGNYTCTHASASSQGSMVRYTGAETDGTPIDVAVSHNWFSGTDAGDGNDGGNPAGVDSTPSVVNSVTSTDDGSGIVLFGHTWGDAASSTPSGTTPTFTERIDTGVTCWYDGPLTTAGATGQKSHANGNNDNGNTQWVEMLLVIDPAGAATGQPAIKRLGGVGFGSVNINQNIRRW